MNALRSRFLFCLLPFIATAAGAHSAKPESRKSPRIAPLQILERLTLPQIEISGSPGEPRRERRPANF